MAGVEPAPGGSAPLESLTYRGVEVAEVIREWNFEDVWALLVDGVTTSPLPPAEEFPLPVRTGDHRVDMQSAIAAIAPVWGFTSLVTTSAQETRRSLARASVMALSFLAQSARGPDVPAVPEWTVAQVSGIARRFLTRWQAEADERYVRAINAGWNAVAYEPWCPSTPIAAHTAATGADVAACLSAAVAASSGPLGVGGAATLAKLLRSPAGGPAVEEFCFRWGFVRREEPVGSTRADALAHVARELGTDHSLVAEHIKFFSHYTHPRFATEFLLSTIWVTHLFTFAGVPPRMLTAMFACGKTAGWSAAITSEHIRLLEKINR